MEDDMWGDDDEEADLLFAHIQETDYQNEYQVPISTSMNPGNNDDGFMGMDNSETDELAALLAKHQNITELRGDYSSLQRKYEDAVLLNTELKNKNYVLEGEVGTLRRRLDEQNSSKQQLILQRMQSMQNAKEEENEERKKLQLQVESLKSQLRLSHVDVQSLEEKVTVYKKQFTKRQQSFGPGNNSFSNPALNTTSPSQAFPTTQNLSLPSSSQSVSKLGKLVDFPTRSSFFAKEVRPQLPVLAIMLKESKTVQTDELVPLVQPCPTTPSSVAADDEDDMLMNPNRPDSTPLLYADIKKSTKRLIAVELQMIRPVVEKTLRYAPTAFKRTIAHRKPRFGLGLEAFDSTALLLQWTDEREMEEFNETRDMQAEYFKRLDQIYDSENKENLQYPPVVDESGQDSEAWADSENFLNSSYDEDEDILDEDEDGDGKEEEEEGIPATGVSHTSSSYESGADTSEDEYELNPTQSQRQPSADFGVGAVGSQSHQPGTSQPGAIPERKPLTFFKEYKLKSKLLTHRNCYKYIKAGQPIEVISEILDGLYEEETGVWNTLYFIKNELRFILDGSDLFDKNRFRVFMTLMVWAKNLWTVIPAAEEQEKVKLSRNWDKELHGWTELMIKVVWRSSMSLVDFCRELRSIFFQITLMIIESGYYGHEDENYRRLFLTIQDSVENPIHHGLLNAQLILDISTKLPRAGFIPFFCRQTIPRDVVLPECFLMELSGRIYEEFKTTPTVPLFDRYLDLLYKLGNPSHEFQPPTRLNRKRKLGTNGEESGEMSDCSEEPVLTTPPNIFKDSNKCACQITTIDNFLLMLSKTFGLWRERFRDIEFRMTTKEAKDRIDPEMNVYRDILVRAFEFIYLLYKYSENIGSSYNENVATYFWDAVGSFKRFRKHFPLRPDMDAMLSHMTQDEDRERHLGDGGVQMPHFLDEEWAQLVTNFPSLNFDSESLPSPPARGPRLGVPGLARDGEDKENKSHAVP